MHAIIAGGGIGGLCTALCLIQHGWQVTVLEKSAYQDNSGAGIQLSPNATSILRALGVLEQLEALAFVPQCLEMRMGKSGRQIFNIPLAEQANQRWGAPYLHIHRADLLKVLVNAVHQQEPNTLRTGVEVKSYQQNELQTSCFLKNGEQLFADVLIAADGIHSTIRSQMLKGVAPIFTGNVAWRAVVPMNILAHKPPPTACVWAGAGKHAVTYHLKGGELANFVGVVETNSWQQESWTTKGSKQQALKDFGDWHPVINNILEKASDHYQWALFDHPPLKQWVDGRVALLGDSCHAMLPFLAQGAAQAIEDGWVLAEELANVTTASTTSNLAEITTALRQYTQRRQVRTAKVQAGARANMKTFHHKSKLAQFAYYTPMWLASRIAPSVVHSRQDWLYGHKLVD